ncbi:phospholipase D family protein [Aquiflexum sp.]|uniref:phospholipase D family protein n=1 Tax=Aquiflexum sp. TaxID=1872584 RepID=UPI0035945CD8
MKVKFLGQGFTENSPNSVGRYLNNYLIDKSFNTFFAISAFSSPLGIKLLESFDIAKKSFDQLNIIVGVDQNGTSKEALEELYNLNVNSFIFYQRESPIFHPKIYLFEGEEKAVLIIGSSNLTGKGLFTNVESSLLIQIDKWDEEGLKVLSDLKDYFHSIFDFTDPNLFKIDIDLIEALVKDGIVPSESLRSKQHGKKIKNISSVESHNKEIPKRNSSKIPWDKLKTKSLSSELKLTFKEELELIGTLEDSGKILTQLLWESGPLTERDLNIPTGKNTNATGSILFKKGKMLNIDQRHFFREDLFVNLTWIRDTKANANHLERASALFQLKIKGKELGVFSFALKHNTKTDTASYRQKNSMTSVSWGDAKEFVGKRELLGLSAKLSKGPGPENFFMLEID